MEYKINLRVYEDASKDSELELWPVMCDEWGVSTGTIDRSKEPIVVKLTNEQFRELSSDGTIETQW